MMWRTFLVFLALASTACSQADGANNESLDETSVSTAHSPGSIEPLVDTPPMPSVERAVMAALDGFVASTIRVNDPPDVNHPDLERFRTGAVLQNAVASVHLNQIVGIGYRLPAGSVYSHTPTIKSIGEATAVLLDCVVDDAQQVSVLDGHVLNDSVATKLFETTLIQIDGAWKITENSLLQRWEGVTTCER